MSPIKVVSFDLEGTLATPDFSRAVWYEGIPSLYAARNGISLGKAKAEVKEEYQKVGDQRLEWYDIKYWVHYFDLDGYQELLESCRHKVAYYPETIPVLSSLGKVYPLIIATGTAGEFLPYLVSKIKGCFIRIFSSVSDYRQLKTASFYLKICGEMGIRPEEMAHVGDNWQFDFTIPVEAGINAFYLNRKGQPGLASITNLRQLEPRLLQL
jgi:FMN phosphatase YigB (HAD superfamily)